MKMFCRIKAFDLTGKLGGEIGRIKGFNLRNSGGACA